MPGVIHSRRRYIATWIALVALTLTSYLLGRLGLGPIDVPVALAIGVVKATLVVLIFMHLSEEPFSVGAALAVALLLIVILTLLTSADPLTREIQDLPPMDAAPRAPL
jgi:cytochrome c oxidase subunit IV